MQGQALLKRQLLPREFIDDYKRERVTRAVAEGAHEKGLGKLTTTEIVARAHIARNTLYRLFPTRQDCLHFSCAEATAQLTEPLRSLDPGSRPRRERVELGVEVLLEATGGEPLLAELALVHSMTVSDPEAPDRHREEVVTALAAVIGEDQIAELAARAIVSAIAMQLMQGQAKRLPRLRDGLVTLAGV